MKNLLKYFALFTLAVIVAVSCNEDVLESDTLLPNANEIHTRSVSNENKIQSYFGPGDIGLSCKGSCGCQLGIKKPDGDNPATAECTCNDCTMNITISRASGKIDYYTLEDAKFELKFYEELITHIESTHNQTDFTLNSIEIRESETGVSYLYDYALNDDESDTVLFASIGGDTTKVVCTGSCGCRERFIFSDPPQAECTCDPCEMDVTTSKN